MERNIYRQSDNRGKKIHLLLLVRGRERERGRETVREREGVRGSEG